MNEGWNKLTLAERQDRFLDQWSSGDGIPFESQENKTAYQERADLMKSAIRIDSIGKRVPISLLTTFAPVMVKGLSCRDALYDYNISGQSYLDFAKNYKADTIAPPVVLMSGPALDTLKYELYKWPGHGVADHLSYQFVEKDWMKADEYDQLINDPTDFYLRSWMPRCFGALAPFANLPPIYGTFELPASGPWLSSLGTPEMQDALKALMEAGKQCHEWDTTISSYILKILLAGFPMNTGGSTKAPFDVLSDSFRGTTPLMMDMFRQPEKILEAMDRLVQPLINMAVADAKKTGCPMIFIPLHKGADGFLSDAQFKKFYWPTFKKVMYGLAEEGCIPYCFVEGGYNDRLEYLAETSDIRCLYLFDKTDMAKAYEVLGGKVCIAGGFPVSQILTNTPDEVRKEVKKLLKTVVGKRGYVLSIGTALDEIKHDTLLAFMESGREYGLY